MRPTIALTALGCVLSAAGLAGCGGKPEAPPSAPAREITSVVERLEQTAAVGDFETLCEEVLTVEAREREGGDRCPQRLRRASKGAPRTEIEAQQVRLRGDSARVAVTIRVEGRPEGSDTLEMVRQAGRWRVEARGAA